MDMAEQMMECGAEVGRVDSTIRHICGAYGFKNVETFTITSLTSATVIMPDGERVSQSRCIGKYSTDMEKLEQLNAMSREICDTRPEISDISRRLRAIHRDKAMNFWRHLTGNCLMALGFSVFFGGNLRDALASALVAVLITLCDRLFKDKSPNTLIYTAICSIFAGLAGIALVKLGVGVNADKVMIGDIMIFIPGLQMVNSIRDLLSGNTITGILKLVDVVLTAVAIAVGFGAALLIFGGAA
jgi:uncharacterized membrane protein YjjP (DUF1212 family)